MTTLAYPRPIRRPLALGVAAALHLLLIFGMLKGRAPTPPHEDVARVDITWITLPARTPQRQPPAATTASTPPRASVTRVPPERLRTPARAAAPGAGPEAAPVAATSPAPAPTAGDGDPLLAAPASRVPAGAPQTQTVLERARRELRPIMDEIRKERKGIIVLPPDSPAIRLRQGIERAADAVPPKPWEAPKVDELVNNTGDGARRTRVRSGLGTYCVTERSPATNVEMIEMHGKLRITNCPKHESPAKGQEWHSPLN